MATYNYAYNNRGRLATLILGTMAADSYVYDGLERLAIRTTQNMAPSGTTQFVYDQAGHLLAESDGSGNTLTEYVWLDDMPIALVANVNTSPSLYFVHADHLNRPIRMTDGSENVVWDAVYNPFGDVNFITGLASNNLRFPGQYFLIEDGLNYNWYRHYDPTVGRYIQPDPLGFIDGPTVYAYARSAPTTNVDPQGLQIVIPVLRPGPGFTPVPSDLFNEWRKNTKLGIAGLLNFCRKAIGSGGGGKNDKCYQRHEEEAERCRKAAWQVAHPDYTQACLDRAADRRGLCIKNGGEPDPNEPPEWTPGPDHDEETWRKLSR